MTTVTPMNISASRADLQRLHGKTVLIKSARDHHSPPAGIRGTIEVRPGADPAKPPRLVLGWGIPDMFNAPAHRRSAILEDAESIRRLLASEHDGTFEFTIGPELD
jgi:hypothetical protein